MTVLSFFTSSVGVFSDVLNTLYELGYFKQTGGELVFNNFKFNLSAFWSNISVWLFVISCGVWVTVRLTLIQPALKTHWSLIKTFSPLKVKKCIGYNIDWPRSYDDSASCAVQPAVMLSTDATKLSTDSYFSLINNRFILNSTGSPCCCLCMSGSTTACLVSLCLQHSALTAPWKQHNTHNGYNIWKTKQKKQPHNTQPT